MNADSRRARVHELDAQWQDLETRKVELQKLCQDLEVQQRELDAEKAVLDSPLASLPDDILIPIMKQLYLHDFPFCSNSLDSTGLSSPITMTHVSRRLRDVAISLPTIWQCIHLDCNQPSCDKDIVKLYLDRSMSQDLSIILVERPSQQHDNGEPMSIARYMKPDARLVASLRTLCSHAHRWRQLAFFFKSWRLHEVLNTSLATWGYGSLPDVTFLSLYLVKAYTANVPIQLPLEPQLELFPSLTHVHFHYCELPLHHSGGFLLNATELSLRWQDLSYDGLTLLASAAPRLTSLTLACVNVTNRHIIHQTYSPATFRALRFLLLSIMDLEGVMVAITAPALRTFICNTTREFPARDNRLSSRLVYPSFPQLQELELFTHVLGDVDLFFRTIPSVVTLDLIGNATEILDVLATSTRTDTPLCPQLLDLTLTRSSNAQQSQLVCSEVLVRFLTWRKEIGRPLRKVTIAWASQPEYLATDALDAIQALGVTVEQKPARRVDVVPSLWTHSGPYFDPEFVLRQT